MTEYYVCKKCRGLKVKTDIGWREFGVRDNCEHKFIYSNVPRTTYKEKKKVKR